MSIDKKTDNASDTTKGNQQISPKVIIPPPMPQSERPAEEKTKEKKGFFEKWKYEIEFAGLLGLIFYCFVNWREWKTFDSERIAMENSQVQDQRAWVVPYDFQIIRSAGGRFVNILIKNTGKTPAINVSSILGGTPSLDQIPKLDEFPNPRVNCGLIAPDGTDHISSAIVPQNVFDSIGNGRVFYIYGTIWYNDIFGNRHWSQFCDAMVKIGDQVQFDSAAIHNSCDDAEISQTK